MKLRIRRRDGLNIVIEEFRKGHHPVTKKPSERWHILGYYGTPIGLAQALVNMCVQVEADEDFIKQIEMFMELTDSKIDAIASQLSELMEEDEVLIELE